MVSIYTRTGDNGESLIKGKKVAKDSLLFEVLGSIDELGSFLGLARVKAPTNDKKEIFAIQKDLVKLSSLICGFDKQFPKSRISQLEKEIDKIIIQKRKIEDFIVAGESEYEALLHIARAITRRTERRIVSLNRRNKINPVVLVYFNRLSDYLFVLSL